MTQFQKALYLYITIVYLAKCLVNGATISNVTEIHGEIQIRHVVRHVIEMIGMEPAAKMDDRRFRFYFFKLHDTNGDNLLDGTELVKSVIHFYDELSESEYSANSTDKTGVYPDEVLAKSVDFLLEAHDSNNDGLLDYLEFTINEPLIF